MIKKLYKKTLQNDIINSVEAACFGFLFAKNRPQSAKKVLRRFRTSEKNLLYNKIMRAQMGIPCRKEPASGRVYPSA